MAPPASELAMGEPSCSPGGPKVGRRALARGGCLPVHIHSAGPAPLLGGVPSSGAHVWLRVPSTHLRGCGRNVERAGVGEYTLSYPTSSLQRWRRAERRSVRRSGPRARASTRSSRDRAPSTSLVSSLTHGGGERRPKAAALAVLPRCRLQWGLGEGPTTWRRARVTVGMVTMALFRTDPPPPCLAQRAPCRGGPAGGGGGSGDGGEAVTDGHCGCASALAESRAGAVRAPWDSACSLLASVLAASGRG